MIIKINKYEFTYSTDIVYDASGSLILLENSNYILGIHKGNNEDKTENYEKVIVKTNSIYMEGDEEDLQEVMSIFDKIGILDKDIKLFSNTIINFDNSIINNLEQINFIGYNYDVIHQFNDEFKN